MTDTVSAYRSIVLAVTALVKAIEDARLARDRIAADSALSTAMATAASTSGRSDLSAADFDNFKVFMDFLAALEASTATQTITNNVNTGGQAVLALYKLM